MIVFYNPHVDDLLAEPPHFRLLGRRPLKKYGYLLEGTLASTGGIHVVVDGTISAFIPDRYFSLLPHPVRRWVSRIELRWWETINHLRGKVSLVTNALEHENHIILAFSYKAATGAFGCRLTCLSAYSTKIVHLSHYFISTEEKAQNLQSLENVWLAGDSDITGNAYFRRFFPWYKQPFVVIPFAVSPRFQVRRPFKEREPLCIATGSFHNLHEEVPTRLYRDYISFFGDSTYHPIRKLIHEHITSLEKWIVSKITPYRGVAGSSKPTRWLKHFSVAQKAYFNVDIVEVYNSYRYAVVGEEATGFPALGAFEAMACGCVLIADPQFYAGWGLQAGKHFIPHDGDVKSIVSAIEMLNADPDMAEAVSKAGTAFVESTCRGTEAYSRFIASAQRCHHES